MSTLQSNVNRFGVKQRGLVMVFALLVLVSLTVLGIASVSSGLLQNKMAVSLQTQTLAFDAKPLLPGWYLSQKIIL